MMDEDVLALARFFQMAWNDFCDHAGWDGPDLQEAIEQSGLGQMMPATAEQAEASSDFEAGDMILVLSDLGRAALARAK